MMFRLGEIVQHVISHERAVFAGYTADGECKISFGLNRSAIVPEEALTTDEEPKQVKDERVTIEGFFNDEKQTALVQGRRGPGLVCLTDKGAHLLLASKAVDKTEFERLMREVPVFDSPSE